MDCIDTHRQRQGERERERGTRDLVWAGCLGSLAAWLAWLAWLD